MDSLTFWQEVEELQTKGNSILDRAELLGACYYAKYVENDHSKAEELKQEFMSTYEEWNDYY